MIYDWGKYHFRATCLSLVKPLSAQLLSANAPLPADGKVEIICHAIGSRPPAKITWWKSNKRLEDFTEVVSKTLFVNYTIYVQEA